jgi:excisionase family DNA binding protein
MQVQERPEGSTTLPGYHTVREAAKLLGISADALYSRIYRTPDIEVIKVGRTLLLSDTAVMRLFAETRIYRERKSEEEE